MNNGFKTVIERVKYLLEKYPEARNDDLYLWILYVRHYDPVLSKYIKYVPYSVISKAPRPETIRRARQYVQNTMGLYPPTDPEVARKRRRAEERMRKEVVRVKKQFV